MRLSVTYEAGSVTSEQECEQIEEGENGLFLKDDNGERLGYIPYDAVHYVVPAGGRQDGENEFL